MTKASAVHFVPYQAIPPAFQQIETAPIDQVKSTLHTWVDECPTQLQVKSGSAEHPVWTQYWSKRLHHPYEPSQVQYLQTILFAIAKRLQLPNVSDEQYCKEVVGLTRWFLGDDKCDSHLEGLPEVPKVMSEANVVEGGICMRWTVDGNRQNPLFYQAGSRGKVDVIKYYTGELKIPVDQPDTASQTPIFYAARDGNLAVIEYLITTCGANVNHTDTYKQSALFYAAKNLRKEAVNLMIANGADVLLRDVQKKTAANWTDDQSIKALIQRAQRGQQKRTAPSGTKGAGPANSKRKRFALTLSCPDHLRWDGTRGYPIIYDADSQEQLCPSAEDLAKAEGTQEKVPYRTTQTIPIIPLMAELERLESQLPSVAVWARDWNLWGKIPDEIEAKLVERANAANDDSEAKSELDLKLKTHLAISLAPFRANWVNEFKKIVQILLQSDTNNWFSRPVDPIQDHCTDYNTVISHPMDFGTIKKKLGDGKYCFIKEVVADIELVFANCFTYNRDASNPVNLKGKELEAEWNKLRTSRFIDGVWPKVEKELIHFLLELRGLDDLIDKF